MGEISTVPFQYLLSADAHLLLVEPSGTNNSISDKSGLRHVLALTFSIGFRKKPKGFYESVSMFIVYRLEVDNSNWLGPELLGCCLAAHRGSFGVFFCYDASVKLFGIR